MSAMLTLDPSKPPGEVSALQELLDDLADDGAVEAESLLIPLWIDGFKLGKVLRHRLVEGRPLGFLGL